MKTINHTPANRLISAAAAATLCVAIVGTARADEGDTPKSNHFSWNFNFDFGNNVRYGSNRTKGSGVMRAEARTVANFSRLVLALPATVTLAQGPTESLTITTDDNLLALMASRVEGGELTIDADKSRGFSSKREIKIRLTVKSLNGITIKGSGDVIGDELKSDKLDIVIAGSGDVKFKSIRAEQFKVGIHGSGDVVVDALEGKSVEASIRGSGDIEFPSLKAALVNISIHGSGDVYAAGAADKVDVEIMGSGDVRARKLVAREAAVKIAASGDAEVHAREKLTASVSGSGEVRYAGSPANVSKTVRGSGSVEPL